MGIEASAFTLFVQLCFGLLFGLLAFFTYLATPDWLFTHARVSITKQ